MIKRKQLHLNGSHKVNRLQIKIKYCILITLSLLLNSCSTAKLVLKTFDLLPRGSMERVISKSEYDYANEVGNEIIRCLKEQDKKSLSDMFCDKVKGSEYLNREIEIVFDYINKNGGLVIKNSMWSVPYSHGSFNDGKSIAYVSCIFDTDVCIGDKEYELRFTAYQLLKNHLEYQGLLNILMFEKISTDIIEKNISNMNDNKSYLGINIYNENYELYMRNSVIPVVFYENDLYLIPDNLEDDR